MCEWFVTPTGGGWHQFKANGSSGNETSRGISGPQAGMQRPWKWME